MNFQNTSIVSDPPAEALQRVSLPGASVHVVDDDPSVLGALARLLSAAGYRAVTHGSGADLLAHMPIDGVACAVLDIRMPGMDGLRLLEELRKKDALLPVLFLTGHGDIPLAVKALRLGAMDFLTKPVDRDALVSAVATALAQSAKVHEQRTAAIRARQLLEKLTPREHEVFLQLLTGMLNKQIGTTLGIAEKTVKVHRGRITRKLKIRSVADAIKLASIAGLPPVEVANQPVKVSAD